MTRPAAKEAPHPVTTFLRFREAKGWAGSQPVVGLAPYAAVEAVLPPQEMDTAFGGRAKYEDAAGNTYLGVWGERKVGRFLALLRRHGMTLAVMDAQPDGLRQVWRSAALPPHKMVRRARKAARQGSSPPT